MEIYTFGYNLLGKFLLVGNQYYCGGLVMDNNEVNTNLPSLRNTDIFQLVVAGDYTKVMRFWQFLKIAPEYRLLKDFRMIFDNLDQKGDLHVVIQMEETTLDRDREVCKVQIRDRQGKEMVFTLLDTQMVEMSDGMIYIRGKNFDIFADPNKREECIQLSPE